MIPFWGKSQVLWKKGHRTEYNGKRGNTPIQQQDREVHNFEKEWTRVRMKAREGVGDAINKLDTS